MRFIYPLAILVLLSATCSKPEGDDSGNVAFKAPTGLKTYGTASENSLSFKWDEVKDATGYAWKLLKEGNEVDSGNTTNRFVEVKGLVRGTAYRFAVSAVFADGQSPWSEYLEATTAGEAPGTVDPVTGDKYTYFDIPAGEEDGVARAFPGAEGGGMYITGGRGGSVLHVDKLNDDGKEGTLRWAVNQKGARTIVFDVAGIIDLQSTLEIKNGDLTIAGQTAPGDGICIRNYSVVIKTDNVIIRFVRFRMGDEKKTEDDATWGRYHERIILDHCSMSWSTDECSSFYGNEYFTMQWCLLTESLTNSVHGKGSHGYGGIWGGKNASFHHNLLSNHNNRTPRFDHPQIYENPANPARRGNVDYRNNVNYNWGSGNGCYGGEGAYINMVGNYYKPGPASSDKHYFIEADGVYKLTKNDVTTYYAYGFPHLYMNGNVHTKYSDISTDNASGVYWKEINGNKGTDGTTISNDGCLLPNELEILGNTGKKAEVTTHSAADAFEKVLLLSGASLRRDAVDLRAVNDARKGTATCKNGGNGSTGGIIDTQTAVGGWPEYKATAGELDNVIDTDKDGMPDWFEEMFGLDEASPADAKAISLDKHGRYSNFEMYLHYLVKDIVSAQK